MTSAPKVSIVADYGAMSRRAAEIVAEAVTQEPGAAISLPTGSTPLGMFDELIGMARHGEIDLSQVHIFCLDDCLAVTAEDPNTLIGCLCKAFISPAGIPTR